MITLSIPNPCCMEQSTTSPACVSVSTPPETECLIYSEIQSDYSDLESDDESEDLPMTELLTKLSEYNEKILFQKEGFKHVKRIKNTAQGEIFQALASKTDGTDGCVQIKKVDKECQEQKISFEDEYEIQYVIDDDIKEEQQILKYLTNLNAPNHSISASIETPIAFFESESDYYLVTELPNMTLKEFCITAQKYMDNGSLSRKLYRKAIERIFAQLSAIINWLHSEMHCCHLGLSIGNISLQNAEFIQNSNKSVSITRNITVKVTEFSKAELFEDGDFRCQKSGYALQNNTHCFSPNRLNEKAFDARADDLWAMGMILYECHFGTPIYTTNDIDTLTDYNGYWAVMEGNIVQYLKMHGLLAKINSKMLSVIKQLLQVGEEKRINYTIATTN